MRIKLSALMFTTSVHHLCTVSAARQTRWGHRQQKGSLLGVTLFLSPFPHPPLPPFPSAPPPFPFPLLSPFPFPTFALSFLRSRPLKSSKRVRGSTVSSPSGVLAEPQPQLPLLHFSLHYLTSGGNKFIDFPQN